MEIKGDIQKAMSASALRRQPLLLAVINEDAQLSVIKEAKLVGRALYHVVRAGTPEHQQVDAMCTPQQKAVIPRVHIFPPAKRGLTPTTFMKDDLTPEMLQNAVKMATDWTKAECTEGVRWALNAARGVRPVPSGGFAAPAAATTSSTTTAGGSSSSTTTGGGSSSGARPPAAIRKPDPEDDATPAPVRVPVATSASPSASNTMLSVELADGSVKKLPFHEKATLNLVRKRLIQERMVENEFFHFVCCISRGDGRDSCQKITKRDEDGKSLRDLGIELGTADEGSRGKLQIVSDATVGRPSTADGPKRKKKVIFLHPGAVNQPDEVEVDGDENLLKVWDTLREPSGDLMFLMGEKKKVSKAEAQDLKANILFKEAKIMLLNNVAGGGTPAGGGAVAANKLSPTKKDEEGDAVPRKQQGLSSSSSTTAGGEPHQSADKDIEVKLVFPGGHQLMETFNTAQPLSAVRALVQEKEGALADNCTLNLAFPPRRFTAEDETTPLRALKISDKSIIRVQYPNNTAGGGSSGGGVVQGGLNFMSKMAGWIPGMGGGSGGGNNKESQQGGAASSSSSSSQQQQRGGVHTLRTNNDGGNQDEEEGDEQPDKKKKGNTYYGGSSTEYQDK